MMIGLDMMGGDYAPAEAVKGISLYLSQGGQPESLLLLGDGDQLKSLIVEAGLPVDRLLVRHTSQVVGMDESPTKALKEKPDSSITVGFQLLATGKIDAFISAGNTGAMMVGSLFSIKVIPGILRPTIGAYMPRENGKVGWLLDAGINADCKPENLVQFAILGSLFVRHVWNIEKPRVGLINIGEEEGKGNLLTQAAYPLLAQHPDIHFVGNLEGRDILIDKADVLVCEGFTGNVVLKLAESVYDIVQRRKIQDEYFDRFHFEQYGGVPVLGVSKPVIIGHGISTAVSFHNMILLAQKMLDKDLLGKIRESFSSPESETPA